MKLMPWLMTLLRGRSRRQREADLERELRSHLELEAEEQAAAGLSSEDAHYAAQRALGNTLRVTESTRAAWGWTFLERLAQDVRFAIRMLRKNLAFTALAVVVLALGIGANTAIFSVVNAALLRPLPYDQPDQIMQVFHTPPQKSFPGISLFAVSNANFLDWQDQQHVFEHISLYHFHGMNLTGTGRPDSILGAEVTQDFFAVMHAQPLLGRVFNAEEMNPGRDREVILSYELWQSHFGGDPTVAGRDFTFDGQSYTVIGVMPERFQMPVRARFWVPAAWGPTDRANRSNHNSLVIARLAPRINLQQAQAEMDTISRRLEQNYPDDNAGWGARVIPYHQQLVADLRTPLLVLLGAVSFVLLIACTNVTNLMLAKTAARKKEIALRTALGASRGRVLQHLMVEAGFLSAAGGAMGLLLAHYGTVLIVDFFGNHLPRSIQVRLDGWVLVFTFGISILCGLLAGLLPALRLTRTDRTLNDSLKEGLGRTDSDSGRGRVRNLLVMAEVVLSTMLLIAAGLLVRTLWVLHNINPGFDPQNVITVTVPRAPLKNDPRHAIFVQQALERLRGLPGVQSAGAVSEVPLSGQGGNNLPVQLEGEPPQPVAQQKMVGSNTVTPGYFAAIRVPILRGRDFNDADTDDRTSVILVNDAAAKRLWPGQYPIGKRLSITFFDPEKMREVVGVVGDIKERGLERPSPPALIYLPHRQYQSSMMSLVVRGSSSSADLIAEVTRAVHEVDKEQPVLDPQTMEHVIADSFSDRRLNMWLLVAFAGLALLLAAAGIYGVLAYSVRRRLREIGIRMALGAQVADVLQMIVMEGLRPTVMGMALGVGGAVAVGRLFTTMIYGVKPTDPNTYVAVIVVLLAVSLGASLLPAYRATRVQPLDVLREE
ncbi:MAG TPA: ABC transporter permease [Candidatus Angelobacter sp.]|nr:ABC transporter permease [Candidatus Angelobacter sp.]